MRWILGVLLVSALLPAVDATPLEIDILELYLAEHDLVSGIPHCSRYDGSLPPVTGEPILTGFTTNTIMERHTRYHVDNGTGMDATADPADTIGDLFVLWHREFIQEFDDWREEHGYEPIPAWDPGTPMPPELAYEFPGRGCVPGRDSDPQVFLPTWATLEGGAEADPLFGYTQRCDFQDMNELGKSLQIEYHVAVHRAVGGDASMMQDPRDPFFWSFHRYLDNVFVEQQEQCLVPARLESQPLPPVGLAPVLVGLFLLLRRSRLPSV